MSKSKSNMNEQIKIKSNMNEQIKIKMGYRLLKEMLVLEMSHVTHE